MKKIRKSTNIIDIANEAEVSTATVSRVLNNSGNVDPDTRKRILALISKSGYKPNTKKNRIRNVCIMIQDTKLTFSLYISAVTTGISDVLIKSGCDVTLVFINQTLSPDVIISMLRERRSDAAIILQGTDDAAFFQFFQEEKIPFIMINNSKAKDFNFVCTDNRQGIRDTLDHLYLLGHRDFGYIVGNPVNHDFIIRKAAFLEYLTEKPECKGSIYNLQEFIFPDNSSLSHTGYLIMKQLHDRGFQHSALLAVNDELAIGMLKACRETNISVPTDLSIVGFDDYEIANYTNPPLTTISQDLNRIGLEAAWGILALMDARETMVQKIILPKLIIRSSTSTKT